MNKNNVRECLKGILGYIEMECDHEVNEFARKIASEAVMTISRETGVEPSIKAYIAERMQIRERQKEKRAAMAAARNSKLLS